MERSINMEYGGANEVVFGALVNKLLPGASSISTGPVIFLEHTYASQPLKNERRYRPGLFAHPHRGVITLRYILSGSLSHHDSLGNTGNANEGDVHWMNAGSGVIHEEFPDAMHDHEIAHSLQFWINLPADLKDQPAQYKAFPSKELPELDLPGRSGMIKVVLGAFGSLTSPIPATGGAFIYLITLFPKSRYRLSTKEGQEYAAFVPAAPALINDREIGLSKMVTFGSSGNYIDLENTSIDTVHLFIYGGFPYRDAYVFEGPFVVGDKEQLRKAYQEFFEDKYGRLRLSDK